MIWGIAGSSGTGKTTLGEKVSEATGVAFVKTSITDMAKRNGYDAISNLPLFERIRLQESLFLEMEALIHSCEKPAILDRTPLDLVGYLHAEVGMHSGREITNQEKEQIDGYVLRCQNLTLKYFDHIFLTAPLGSYMEASNRPAYNPGYQRHLHLIVTGALIDTPGNINYSLLRTTNLNDRVCYVSETIEKRLNYLDVMRSTSRHIH